MGLKRRTAIVAALLAILVARGFLPGRGLRPLPPTLVETVLIDDLSAGVDGWTVRTSGTEPVRIGTVEPGNRYVVDRGPRPALVTPPGTELRARRRVQPGTALAFAIAVQGRGVREAAAGLRFDVDVDGRPVYSRMLNPAARRRDRAWVEAHVDLGVAEAKDVEITLRTVADGPAPPAGIAGWSHVRLVQAIERTRQRVSADAPNVLVLLVDTLRADALGCYGATPSPSPTLDAFARRGLRFEQTIAQASWTMPSVASVLTGLHPRVHGVTGGDDGPPGSKHTFLPDAVTTLAEEASRAGITTLAVSANPLVSRGTNYAQGFETFVEFGIKDGQNRNNWMPATAVNKEFLDWLAANRGYRFFGYLHYMEPHHPYAPPARHMPAPVPGIRREVVDGDLGEWHAALASAAGLRLTEPELRHLRNLYAGEVAAWDDAFETLLEGIEAAGIADHTIVLVTADHGEEFDEHNRLGHGYHLYDELLRVPLVIAGPGIPAGVRGEQVQGIDVFPTVAARLGLPAAPGLLGRDVLSSPTPRPAISEVRIGVLPDLRTAPLVSVREGGWKLLAAPELASFQLFDLQNDPGETRDRHHPSIREAAALHATLDAFLAAAPAAHADAPGDPAIAEKLRALGYAE